MEKYPYLFGYFVSLRTGYKTIMNQYPWASDNDCFNGKFEPASFLVWLLSLRRCKNQCLFITVPDVVGDAHSTLAQFPFWRTIIKGLGLQCALALQDGVQSSDIPWSLVDAVFVGGTTDWKLSQDVIRLLQDAQEHHKWRHIGRVNSFERMYHFWDYADSFDGTGFSIAPDRELRRFLPRMRARRKQSRLL